MYTVKQTNAFKSTGWASQTNGLPYDSTRVYQQAKPQRDTVSLVVVVLWTMFVTGILAWSYALVPVFRSFVNSLIGG